jgi:pimeloyl-ACP methyl ester carboxylesterase
MAGQEDIIKEKHTKCIAENLAHSKLLIVQKQTHAYFVENPKSINEAVLNFINNPT